MLYYSKIRYINEMIKIRFNRLIKNKHAVLENSISKITVPTYDGSGQAVHPCVIDFKNEFSMGKWGEYRYWMVITPYPFSDDSSENPCLYASEDGITWVMPEGLVNPLDYSNGGWKEGFNNDPDMIYVPEEDKLFIYYRFANNKELKVKLIKIDKDLICEKPITVMCQSPWDHAANKHRSLCIFREAPDMWHMWGGGGTEHPPYKIYHFSSKDGIHWSKPEQCLDKYKHDPLQVLGIYNWHMCCKPNYRENRIEFLCYYFQTTGRIKKIVNRTLKKTLNYEFNPKSGIVYAECDMNQPAIFSLPISKDILHASKHGWDNYHIYRATFQIYDTGENYSYKVWYSAVGKDGRWGIGCTTGNLETRYSKLI